MQLIYVVLVAMTLWVVTGGLKDTLNPMTQINRTAENINKKIFKIK